MSTSAYPILGLKTCCDTCFYYDTCTKKNKQHEILNMLGGSRLLYKDDTYAYIFEVPTDVQYPIWADRDENDIEIAAEYEEMFKDVTKIAGSFTGFGTKNS